MRVNEEIYTREEMIQTLRTMEQMFCPDDVARVEFRHNAKYIEECYDYLVARLRHAEAERFERYIK